MTNIPVNNSPFIKLSGLIVSNDATTPNTSLDVSTGYAYDSTLTVQINLASAVVIDATKNGVNALDTGSLTASTWYTVYLLGSSLNKVQPCCVLSLTSQSSPVLPAGYDVYEAVAYWYVNSSTHFVKGYVFGNAGARKFYYDAGVSVLSAGAATALTAVNLITAVPPLPLVSVNFQVEFTPGTAGHTVGIATAGSTATILPHVTGAVATVVSSGHINQLAQLSSGNPTVQYIGSNAGDATTLYVTSFEYSL